MYADLTPLAPLSEAERGVRRIFSPLLALVIMALVWIGMLFFPIIPALAQADSQLLLTLSRNFGFSSGGRIQGAFSAKAAGPGNLQRVVFLIDGQTLGEDDQAPFSIQFHTGDFSLGEHTLSAVGYTSDGQELRSNDVRREFVSAEQGWRTGLKIAIPIIAVSIGVVLLSALLPVIFGRRKGAGVPLGTPRSYGILGGTICPKCRRPFGIHIWGLDILVGKIDRCPHCGRWSLVRRVSPEALKAAEAAELDMAERNEGAPSVPPEEALRKELDNSRYLDL